MIYNEAEYQQALTRLDEDRKRLIEHCQIWKDQGFTPEQLRNLKEPLETFILKFVEEIEHYERSQSS
ncbi:MAG: hypothetical protein JKX85_05280 [Phycisphaeraceae bacterium]|nr:hypothetical protein [Phycisphaeraceae bacterium]